MSDEPTKPKPSPHDQNPGTRPEATTVVRGSRFLLVFTVLWILAGTGLYLALRAAAH
jgi:hypothetical protein